MGEKTSAGIFLFGVTILLGRDEYYLGFNE